jgi:hypothetical protein
MPNTIVEQKGRIISLLRLPLFRYSSSVAFLAILAAIALPLWRLFPDIYGRPVVPLHYNIHYGVDWTGAWWQIFLLPGMGVAFFVVNTGIALFFVRRNLMLTSVALCATAILALLLFAAMVFVVSLNIVYG